MTGDRLRCGGRKLKIVNPSDARDLLYAACGAIVNEAIPLNGTSRNFSPSC
jgi:hypothetical protein